MLMKFVNKAIKGIRDNLFADHELHHDVLMIQNVLPPAILSSDDYITGVKTFSIRFLSSMCNILFVHSLCYRFIKKHLCVTFLH